jgi:hypothetical protein
MKTLICLLAFIPFFVMADHHEESKPTPSPYRHIVMFKFKDNATKEQTGMIEREFIALSKKIATITDFEWGTNVSPENHAQGFTHCFVVSFKDKAGLEVYLPHKAHKAFVATLLPVLDKVLVVDFVSQK